MKRSVRFRVGAALLIGSALVACALDPLNPQPLPPSPETQFGMDAGAFTRPSDAGSQATDKPKGDDDDDSLFSDAAVGAGPDGAFPPSPLDAGTDADAGDAGKDADAH